METTSALEEGLKLWEVYTLLSVWNPDFSVREMIKDITRSTVSELPPFTKIGDKAFKL